MGRGVYHNIRCAGKWNNKFVPRTHQKETVKKILNSPERGMLLYHRLGSGKTCTAIIAADNLLLSNKYTHVYIITPGSLRFNWIKEYCNVCGENEIYLRKNYTFITYNYDARSHLPKNFNNSVIIIDEVHNLINGVKNRSVTYMKLWEKLAGAKNCKILALSGTPLYNNIYEWSLLGNLLKPGTYPDIFDQDNKLNVNEFMGLFEVDADGKLTAKNLKQFMKDLSGIVSYYAGDAPEFYPRVTHEKIVKLTVPESTAREIVKKIDSELKIMRRGMPVLPKNPTVAQKKAYEERKELYMIAVKRIQSRKLANFKYPKYPKGKYPDDELPPDAIVPKGWIDRSEFSQGQLHQYSPKFVALITNILDNFNSKHMVFTYFKTRSGVNLLKTILEMCGVPVAVYSGDLSDIERQAVLHQFNSAKNRFGDIIKIMFVTHAGGEGISLKETGHVHILESDPRSLITDQAVGRAVRFESHILLPKDLQNVHVWRYWSTYPGAMLIDERLYERAIHRMNMLTSFLKLLQKAGE